MADSSATLRGGLSVATTNFVRNPPVVAIRSTLSIADHTLLSANVPGLVYSPVIEMIDGDLSLSGAVRIFATGMRPSPNFPLVDGTGRALIGPTVFHTPPLLAPQIQRTDADVPTLAATTLVLGDTTSIDVRSSGGGIYLLAAGEPDVPTSIPGILGNLWLSRPALLASGSLLPGEVANATVQVPSSTAVLGIQLGFQTLLASPSAPPVWSHPTSQTVQF